MGETYDVAVVGTGVIGLAVTAELLARGMTVAVIGPGGDRAGGATRAAGAMLSTFAEIEPRHDAQHTAVQTAERLAAYAMYPAWLERITTGSGTPVCAEPGTWVLAPAGRRGHLEVIAAAARAAGHPAELHDHAQIPGVHPPPTSAGALWLPTECRIDTAALMVALARSVRTHSRCSWHDGSARSVTVDRVCVENTEVHAEQVVLAAGTAIPGLLPEDGRALGVPPILAGRGVSVRLEAPALPGVEHVVRTPNAAFACGMHIVPGAEGTLYVGATNRLTTVPDPDRAATLGELRVLASEASALLDARLGGAGVLSTRTGLRPYTLDHLPMLGRTAEPTLVLATATYRCGILLAPRVAALIADEITSPGALDSHPYRALRPMPTPEIHSVLDESASDLLEHLLQGGGQLPPGAGGEFIAFTNLALRALLDEQSEAGLALRRLWQAAPVHRSDPRSLRAGPPVGSHPMTRPPTHTDPRERVLDAIRALRRGQGEVDENASLAELGLDSLDRVALAVAVERSTALALPDLALVSVRTVAELIAHLRTARCETTASITSPDKGDGAGEGGWVEDGAHAGPGTRLWHQAQIAADATVGRDCTLGKGAYVGAGSRVGDLVKIGNYACVFGARIADRVMICPGALLLEDPAPRATTPDGRRKQSGDFVRLPVTIGHGATIGAGAVIASGASVGPHALVALGAVVVRDVAAHALVAGNPARHCGWVCTCGHTLNDQLRCPACHSGYTHEGDNLSAPGVSCCDSSPKP